MPDAHDTPGRDAFDSAPWLDLPAAVLAPCRGVPTMLTPAEERLYWWLGAVWAQDAGAVVDLGCFLGGSTARLAEGLAAGGRRAQVVAYDRFRIAAVQQRRFLDPSGLPRPEGTDALPLVRRLLAPWGDRVDLRKADLGPGLAWDGGAVEILVVDIAKSAEGADALAAAFFPALVPGRSVVVQQDFLHRAQPWLPAQMALFGDAFEPVAHCPPDSVTFLCRRPVTPARLEAAQVATADDATLADALAAAAESLAGWGLSARVAAQAAALAAAPGARSAAGLRAAMRTARKAPGA
jgi:hypothetical protein